MNKQKSYGLIAVVSVLLISLLINQINYVYKAALEQETYFVDKVNLALGSIVNTVSDDYEVCQSVGSCFKEGKSGSCQTAFKSKEEWDRVDSIIKRTLQAYQIDLNYNFDFCIDALDLQNSKNANTFSKTLTHSLPKSSIVMTLEFPSKSNYVLKQIGPAFISSILIIFLISLLFVITFRFYKKEKINAERTRGFLNNMTHEFKTPLANIAFANNMLSKQASENNPDKIKRYTQIIRVENEKMIANSEDILEMAKLEFNKSSIYLEDVDSHDVIYGLQKCFMSTQETHLQIDLALHANRFEIKGKTTFFQNAISNIIDNAIKYCNTTPKISITTSNENNLLVIIIKDNGIGISKKDLDCVFDKFYRVSEGDRHDVKGFGLGLAYVKMIVEQMNGTITLQSKLGKGSVFILKIPTVYV